MTILVIYATEPKFPVQEQNPNASRIQVNGLWVDYLGAVPDQAAIDALLAPGLNEQNRVAAVKLNGRRQALINAFLNNDDAGLLAAAAARYPSLAGDALKAVQDIILVIAGSIRG